MTVESESKEELERLVLSALAGDDDAAVRQLSRRACTLALRTAAVVMASSEEAADVSQDVAVDVMRNLGQLRDPKAFDSWVYRITSRRARRALGRRADRGKREIPFGLTSEGEETTPDAAELVGTRDALAAALGELPPRQRIAMALHYVHDLNAREIASAMGCREGTVHALLSRARSTLRTSNQLEDLRPLVQGERR